MSDEIDIEEHNLLENPVLKKIFPDISAIKQEIFFPFDYNTQDGSRQELKKNGKSTTEYNFTSNESSFKYLIKIEDSEEQEEGINKMIIDQDLVNTEETGNDVILSLESPGSRHQILEETYIQKLERYTLQNMQTQIMHINVVLDNVEPYLKRSKRFCNKCLILFPETDKLTKHNYIYHGDKPEGAITASVINKCATKEVHTKNYSNYFSCDKCTTLCKNFYILKLHKKRHEKGKERAKTLPCDKCDKLCQNHHNLRIHKLWHERLELKLLKKEANSKKFMCHDCGLSCQNSYILKRHRVKRHSMYSKKRREKHEMIKEIKNTGLTFEDNVYNNEADTRNQDIRYKQIDSNAKCTNTENNANFSKNSIQTKHQESNLNVSQEEKVSDSAICCTHCSNNFPNKEKYINHLYSIIHNKFRNEESKTKDVKEEDKAVVLKSVLYKCRKCDIHFIYAKTAMNHVQHMDLLINWKCTTCSRIFKNEDKYFHLMQHLDQNHIKVYDLCETEFLRVLYKCPKCAVHFSEDNFISHYSVCGHKTNQSKYCKICDILVEENTFQDHKKQHIIDNLSVNDFIFVVTELITGYSSKITPVSKNNHSQEVKMYYCDVCECFLTGVKSHDNQTCLNKRKYICKLCGLRIPIENMSGHGKLHSILGNLKLRNFKFFDLKGNQIIPPMSRFPHCDTCLVHFTSKMATDNHVCGKINYVVCNSCHEKFTKIAFRLHSRFHSYVSSGNEKKSCSNQKNNKKLNCYSLETLVIEKSVKEEISKKKLVVSIPKLKNPILKADTQDDDTSEMYKKVVYSCNGCEIVFDGYDAAVEHCQLHYKDKNIVFSGKHCGICGLIYETNNYEYHTNSHSSNKEKYFKISFDLDYFIQENAVWVEHVFGSIPESVKNDIFKVSIYKFEARIKMIVTQDGTPELTIYQCDFCNLCVEIIGVFNHTKNCFNQKSHPCSFCGLRFVSYIGRMAHENVHNANISFKSFRLVKFNRKCDKQDNDNITSLKKYVLYQCRNCNGIINIYKFSSHTCEPMELCSCLQCGLLIQLNDIRLHKKKHAECFQYVPENMKIILCGQKKENVTNMQMPTFTGFICDYTFYKCARCETCVKDFQRSKHVCTKTRFKCDICDLHFLTNGHKKLHEKNLDFVKWTINLIEFNSSKDNVSKNKTKTVHDFELQALKNSSIAEIYKCPFCTLHFLDNQSISKHVESCNTKIRDAKESTEKCTKCDLMFNSSSLFNHLIKHHGRDGKKYDIKLIDINSHNFAFKCSKCPLHFTTYAEAFEHTTQCSNIESVRCTICELEFSRSCLQDHVSSHSNKSRSSQIVSVQTVKAEALNFIESKIDGVLNRHLDLAKTSLLSMNIGLYSNILYRCNTCNVHFLDKNIFFVHVLKNVHCSIVLGKCNICNLNFELSSLTPHVFVHHKRWGLLENDFIVMNAKDYW